MRILVGDPRILLVQRLSYKCSYFLAENGSNRDCRETYLNFDAPSEGHNDGGTTPDSCGTTQAKPLNC